MKTTYIRKLFPQISSNLKLLVKNEKEVYLTINSNNLATSNSRLKMFPIQSNRSFSEDVFEYYSNTGGKEYYNDSDEELISEGKITAPLWIEDEIPDYFVLFDNDSDDFANNKILKVFSLKSGTIVGDYLRKHLLEIKNNPPIIVNSLNQTISINLISISKGIIQRYEEKYEIQEDLDLKILEIIRNKFGILPNLINLQFDISEVIEEKIVFKYCTAEELFNYIPSIYRNNDYLPPTYERNTSLLEFSLDGASSDSNPINFENESWRYVFIKDVNENFIGFNRENGILKLNERANIDFKVGVQSEIKLIDNPDYIVVYELKEKFEQSDFVTIEHPTKSITLISDSLPNYTSAGNQFSSGNNLEHIFHPGDSIEDSIAAFVGSWNDTRRISTNIKAIRLGNRIAFIAAPNSSSNVKINHDKIIPISSDIIDMFNSNAIIIDSIKIPLNDNLWLQNQFGLYRVVNIRSNTTELLSNSDGELFFNNFDSKSLLLIKNLIGEANFKSILIPSDIIVGYFNPIPESDGINIINTIGSVVADEELTEFFMPIKLSIGTNYIVASNDTVIEILNDTFTSGQTFTAESEIYKVNRGLGFILEENLYQDNTIKSLLNNVSSRSLKESSNKISWIQLEQTELDGQPVDLIQITTPGNGFIPNIGQRTTEWFVANRSNKTLGYTRNIYNLTDSLTDKNYFDITVGEENYSEFIKDGNSFKTIFKGVQVVSNEELEDYKFSIILNHYNQIENKFRKGLNYDLIKDDNQKALFLLIEVPLFHYLLREDWYYSFSYFCNNAQEDPINNGTLIPLPLPLSITNEIITISGHILPITATSSINNVINFNNNVKLENIIIPNEIGEVHLVGIDPNRNTVISTKGLYNNDDPKKFNYRI